VQISLTTGSTKTAAVTALTAAYAITTQATAATAP
jgi:hypothetical protein